jgi:hypothetical protein
MLRARWLVVVALLSHQAVAQKPPQPGDDRTDQRIPWKETVRSLDEISRRQIQDLPALKTARFREAIRGFQPGKLPDLLVTWGEFVTADGIRFISLQLAPAADNYLKPGTNVVVFAELTGPSGKPVLDYEESLPVNQSKHDVFVEQSFAFPETHVVATFGVAVANEIVAMTRVPLEIEQITRLSPGVSRLILSDNLYTMTKKQQRFDSFAFGGTKVVPKPGRSFHRTDEVWFFEELRNPSLDPQKVPHVTAKVEIEGNGKTLSGTPTPVDPSPLKGVAGHYGIGSTIDLSRLTPGDYKLRVTIRDAIASIPYVREETLRVVD